MGLTFKRHEGSVLPAQQYAELCEFANHLHAMVAAFEPQLARFKQRLLDVDRDIEECAKTENGKNRKREIWKVIFETRHAVARLEKIMARKPEEQQVPPTQQQDPVAEAAVKRSRRKRKRII